MRDRRTQTAPARWLRKVLAVARHELVGMVTRPGYLIALVGTPLFIAGAPLLSAVLTSRAMVAQAEQVRAVGFFDESGLFERAPREASLALSERASLPVPEAGEPARARAPGTRQLDVLRFVSREEGLRALAEGRVGLLLRIPPGYLADGRVDEFRKSRSGLELTSGHLVSARALSSWFVAALAAERLEPATAGRLAMPVEPTTWVLGADGGISPEDTVRELGPLIVPLGFSLLLMLSIFTSASYLATGLAEEKQNRALEMMLTSLSPEQLFWGKLLGLGMAALLQFLLYLVMVAVPAAVAFTALGLQPWQALAGLAYFVLGFFFYGAVLLAMGSIGDTQKFTQQLAGLATFGAMVPFLVMPALLGAPQGRLARIFTYLPFTAPITGMLRVGAGALPAWELLLSLASLAIGALLMVRACSKIFRVALLSTGAVPGLAKIWAWLRE